MSKKRGGLFFLFKIAYRNIYRNLRRSILCIIAISIAVLVIIFMMSFLYGMIDSLKKIITVFETSHIRIYANDYEDKKAFLALQYPVEAPDNNLDDFLLKLESIDGINKAFPRIKSVVTLTNNDVKHAYLWGFNLEEEFKFSHFNLTKKNNGLVEGRYPEAKKNECAIGKRFAKRIGLKIGDRIEFKVLSSQFSDKFASPVITGLFDFDYHTVDRKFIIMPLKRMQKLVVLNNKAQIIHLFVDNDNIKNIPELTETVREHVKGKNLTVKNWRDDNWYFNYVMSAGLLIYNIIFAVFIIVASFLIVNTIIMVIHERMKEIGMMSALGLDRGEIVRIFFLEAVFLSLFGAILGAILGGILTGFLSNIPISYETMAGGAEMPISNTIYVKFSFKYIFGGLFYGLILSSICTILPSLKAAFIEPVEALRR
ncbi:MAG: ABC transporter permease [Spirochaetes bacterium]|nr:ABC transporter permease [Spirochaetota bacterium]